MSDITIRSARPADAAELRRLAELDSRSLPSGDLLVAEVSGELVAAYAPESAATVADPFRRTAEVVDLLRLRAAGTRPGRDHRHRIFALPRTA